MATYLVTGAAGFIASKVSELLLDRGDRVVGVDNLNDAYDVRLKEWRLARLIDRDGFHFEKQDIADRAACSALFQRDVAYDGVINLAARAGVRQSITVPKISKVRRRGLSIAGLRRSARRSLPSRSRGSGAHRAGDRRSWWRTHILGLPPA